MTKWQKIQKETQPLNNNFELNGKWFVTDDDGIKAVRSVIKSYRDGGSKDNSAVVAIMLIGDMTGRIQQIN